MKAIKKINNIFAKATILLGFMLLVFVSPSFAHCDSYDGPVILDAQKALKQENVSYVMKWVESKNEKEITDLFQKTIKLKNGDKEIYNIVEKHFLETLVRLHRETEGAAYTGLKPAGSASPIVQMADKSIENKEVKTLLGNLDKHIGIVVAEKFEKVNELSKVKDNSVEQGRAYVAAYVDYTHTLEAIENVLSHGGGHH